MPEQRPRGLWNIIRQKSSKELDEMERKLIFRPFEKREFAGDPEQAKHFWVRLRKK